MTDLPQVGDEVSIMYPNRWERFGTVVETDYHPTGKDDSVKIQFKDEINNPCEWWDVRWVRKKVTK